MQKFSQKLGLTLFSTPFDFQSLVDLETLDLPFYKLASADIVHLPLIDHMVKTGKNIIISTGSATYEDIDRCLDFIDDRYFFLIRVSVTNAGLLAGPSSMTAQEHGTMPACR